MQRAEIEFDPKKKIQTVEILGRKYVLSRAETYSKLQAEHSELFSAFSELVAEKLGIGRVVQRFSNK